MCKLKAEPPGLSMRMHPFATVDRFPRCVTFIQITLAKQEDWMAAVSHLLYEQRALALNPIIKQRGVSFQHRNKRYSLVHVLMRNRLQKRFAPSLLLIQCNDNEALKWHDRTYKRCVDWWLYNGADGGNIKTGAIHSNRFKHKMAGTISVYCTATTLKV